MVRRLWIALVFVACSRASDESQAKKWQAPPPDNVEIPSGLSIGVTIDGSAKPPITSDMLKSTKPDFVDDDHRAWRIPTLLGTGVSPGTTIEAASPIGVAVKFTQPLPDGYEPVLFLSRRGEVIVAAVDPKDPFPRFHGQGSRLRRPGDSMPRVAPVTRLLITRPTP